jgi:predicted transposase YdaD
VIETLFQLERTRHEYQVVKLWEQDPDVFLQDVALMPLAVLAAASDPAQLLNRVAQQVSNIESLEQRQETVTCTQLLAGLRFKREIILQAFRGRVMRESVIHQDILEEGKLEGELALILRQLVRRLGAIAPQLQSQIEALPLPQLEDLGEALLDFSDTTDLVAWLAEHPLKDEESRKSADDLV